MIASPAAVATTARIGSNGDDKVSGNGGNDRLEGNNGKDQVNGGRGNDRISVRDGRRDVVNCGRGRDRVTADRRDRVAAQLRAGQPPLARKQQPAATKGASGRPSSF